MSSSMPKKIGENQYQIDADPNLGMNVPVKIMLMSHCYKKCYLIEL